MSAKPPPNPLIVVLGATGTGKSELAVDLARRFNGEIINGDAMQMYAGLPIITNKISAEEQRGIPHHLLGNIGLDEETWTVGVFRRQTSRVLREIRGRGRVPILVGGTHYYTQKLLFGDRLVGGDEAGEGVEEDQGAGEGDGRREGHVSTEEIAERFPILEAETSVMLEELRRADPVMAERWHPNDRRKIRRSLEIWLRTGKRASDVYREQREQKGSNQRETLEDEGVIENSADDPTQSLQSTLLFWVHAESEALKTRLDKRVDKMIANGLLDEVKSLESILRSKTAKEITVDRTRGIWVSIGYKEFEPYLTISNDPSASEADLQKAMSESIERTQAATRQYARRQIRWIRLKLLPALVAAGAHSQLFVLDGSDLTCWLENVSAQAISIAEKFMAGEEMPAPVSLGDAARELLADRRDYDFSDRPDLWMKRTCELCGVTTVVEDQWKLHVKSRGHRRAVKNRDRKPQWGRPVKTVMGQCEEDGGIP